MQAVQKHELKPRMPAEVCGLGTITGDLVPEEEGFTRTKCIQPG